MTDLERAIAVIADLCGAGRPAVKESAEELASWAEEFTDRYFQRDYSAQQFEPDGELDEQGFPVSSGRSCENHGCPNVAEGNSENLCADCLKSWNARSSFINLNHATTCTLRYSETLQGISSACGCGGLAKDRAPK
jgi:hypothetical protein